MIKILTELKISDIITIINALFGFGAILAAYNNLFQLASILVIIAAIADGLDGTLARHIGGSRFGETLDSLADIISFGVAPAVIFTTYFNNSIIVFISMCLFLICGILRLARFSVLTSKKIYFEGLPITAAAITLIILLLVGENYIQPILISMWSIILSLLMISNVTYVKIRNKNILFIVSFLFILSIFSYLVDYNFKYILSFPLLITMIIYLISPIIKIPE